MSKNLFLLLSILVMLTSCSQNGLEKTKSYKDKHEYNSQELGDEAETIEVEMTLQDKLDAYAEISKSKLPNEYRKIMVESLQRLKNQELQSKFYKIGDKAPNFKLDSVNGEKVELYDLLKEKAVVVVFYRGSWCPYCNLELKEYKDYYAEFQDAGLEILAISPETPNYTEAFQNKNFFPFPLLYDKKAKVGKKYHLNFELDPELVPIYQKIGIDIGVRNGNGRWTIPVPATMIIGQDKKIYYNFADIDYKNRAEPDSVLAVAKATLK